MYIATNLGAQISDETFGKKYLFGPNRQKMGVPKIPPPLDASSAASLKSMVSARVAASNAPWVVETGPQSHRFPLKLAKDFAMAVMTHLKRWLLPGHFLFMPETHHKSSRTWLRLQI